MCEVAPPSFKSKNMESLKTSFASLNSPQQCLLFSFCGENMCENSSGNQSFMIITDTSPRSATTPPCQVLAPPSPTTLFPFSPKTVFCSQFCGSPPQAAPGDSDKSQIPKCNSHTCISHIRACKIVREQFASFAVYIHCIFFFGLFKSLVNCLHVSIEFSLSVHFVASVAQNVPYQYSLT